MSSSEQVTSTMIQANSKLQSPGGDEIVTRSLLNSFEDADSLDGVSRDGEAIKKSPIFQMARQIILDSADRRSMRMAVTSLIQYRQLTEENLAFIKDFQRPDKMVNILVFLDRQALNNEACRSILRERYLNTDASSAQSEDSHRDSLADALNNPPYNSIFGMVSGEKSLFYFQMLTGSPSPYSLHGGLVWLQRESLLNERNEKLLAAHPQPLAFAKALIALYRAGQDGEEQIRMLADLAPEKMAHAGELLYRLQECEIDTNLTLFAKILNHAHPDLLENTIGYVSSMRLGNGLLSGDGAYDILVLLVNHENQEILYRLLRKLGDPFLYDLFSDPRTGRQNLLDLLQAGPELLNRIEAAFERYPPDLRGNVRFADRLNLKGEPVNAQQCLDYVLHPERRPSDLTQAPEQIATSKLKARMRAIRNHLYTVFIDHFQHHYIFGRTNTNDRLFPHAFAARIRNEPINSITYTANGNTQTVDFINAATLAGDRLKRYLLDQIQTEIKTILLEERTDYSRASQRLATFQEAVLHSSVRRMIHQAQGLYTATLHRLGFYAPTDSENALLGMFEDARRLLEENREYLIAETPAT